MEDEVKIPSKERYDARGEGARSFLTIISRRAGAGLHGIADGTGEPRRFESSWMNIK